MFTLETPILQGISKSTSKLLTYPFNQSLFKFYFF